jgi:hypothetical protein
LANLQSQPENKTMKNWITSALALACLLAAGTAPAQKLPLHVAARALELAAELKPVRALEPASNPPLVSALDFDRPPHPSGEREGPTPGPRTSKEPCKACTGQANDVLAAARPPAGAAGDNGGRSVP